MGAIYTLIMTLFQVFMMPWLSEETITVKHTFISIFACLIGGAIYTVIMLWLDARRQSKSK